MPLSLRRGIVTVTLDPYFKPRKATIECHRVVENVKSIVQNMFAPAASRPSQLVHPKLWASDGLLSVISARIHHNSPHYHNIMISHWLKSCIKLVQ